VLEHVSPKEHDSVSTTAQQLYLQDIRDESLVQDSSQKIVY